MKVINENIVNVENIAARIIDTILHMTEHNPVSLSGVLGISLKKLVLKEGFSTDEVSLIVGLGSTLSIN
ncbi:hypothetical protein SAMN02746093_02878 [Legionella quinlivanii DSM 21216]|uniref:hypothetical protein n=1 Tax=Legionella quinlivanii TaxID=45073 RepID=UPI00089F7F34|nr:hypothetical protein [Legionella quinlivanii]SEG42009.1 hypothetical protein SAMN02746093_02878 [Legionella quinlivanii DSM 21216]